MGEKNEKFTYDYIKNDNGLAPHFNEQKLDETAYNMLYYEDDFIDFD